MLTKWTVTAVAVVWALATASVAGAVRPGPPILYAPPAEAPQLQNTGIWHAAPILISGVDAYRDGEYLYQGFLYDDNGAKQSKDDNDPRKNNDFSKQNGTYTYPSDPAYAENAADLVELRVRPLTDATAFRVTLNTMKDPALVAFAIALGGKAGHPHPFPFGAEKSSLAVPAFAPRGSFWSRRPPFGP